MRAILVSLAVAFAVACASPLESPMSENATASASEQSTPAFALRFTLAEMPRAVAEELLGSADLRGAIYPIGKAPDLSALAASRSEMEVRRRTRIVVRDGAPASLADTEKESYVKDYTVEAGRPIPIRDSIEHGYWVDAVPTLSADRAKVVVDLAVRSNELTRPIREMRVTPPGTTESVVVQLPDQKGSDSKMHISLDLGQGYAFTLDPVRTIPPNPRAVLVVMTIDRADR